MRKWLSVAADCWLLGAEASLVLPLRLARMARGGAAAKAEARLMVTEKVAAHGKLIQALAMGQLGKDAPAIVGGVARHYLAIVRANRQRLADDCPVIGGNQERLAGLERT